MVYDSIPHVMVNLSPRAKDTILDWVEGQLTLYAVRSY